jgi:hypothetical protein
MTFLGMSLLVVGSLTVVAVAGYVLGYSDGVAKRRRKR